MFPVSAGKKPIVIMGANASGKTSLSLFLAKVIGGEIFSFDSRQIYKHLRAGTSKPPGRWQKDERGEDVYLCENIPYRLVDFLDPNFAYDAAKYAQDFLKEYSKISKSDKIPIIVGGTGMYLNAIFNGLDPLPKSDREYRKELVEISNKRGKIAVYEILRQKDPVSAARIHPNNIQRVIRALEIYKILGRPASQQLSGNFMKDITIFPGLFVFLKWEKPTLKERIKKRTELEFDEWVRETENLISSGYPHDCPGLRSLGYCQVLDHIEGKITRKKSIDQIVSLSIDYAKRQNTWFSRYSRTLKIEFSTEKDFEIEKTADLIIANYVKIK